ncbi:MAG TPA: acetylxylan esterase, partial [Pirellulaceae bacterium]|nr:acetylxylan esterase [Pirellulaceae bacterium]
MLGKQLRGRIEEANHQSSQEWSKIRNKEEWETFLIAHRPMLRQWRGQVRASRDEFGKFEAEWQRESVRAKPVIRVASELGGDGFRVRNLLYLNPVTDSWISANLYLPSEPRDSMPGILISHSHHNSKEQGELQDMGMTWARAGCAVLVPDHLGHGERRQHPFRSAADFDGQFAVGRQDYYFRYDVGIQLLLYGQSLMGAFASDLSRGVSVLLANEGVDPKRIILLGSVAGGGDPAAVTAAIDDRITCVVPFNFGGPQPETRYPLPDDAETWFNYAGGGSWESTRNLRLSARDGFLPWVIVGSVAPRGLIHAHE